MTSDPILDTYDRDALELDVLDREVEADEEVVAPVRWHVTDDARAGWALRKLAACVAELDEIRQRARAEVERIAAWESAASAEPARFAAKLDAELRRYAIERREETGAATLSLPTGKVSTRQNPVRIDVDDEAAATAALERLANDRDFADDAAPTIRRADPEVSKRDLARLLVDPHDDEGWLVAAADGSILDDVRSVTVGEGDDAEERTIYVRGDRRGERYDEDPPVERVDPFAAVVAFQAGGRLFRFVVPGVRRSPGDVTATPKPAPLDLG